MISLLCQLRTIYIIESLSHLAKPLGGDGGSYAGLFNVTFMLRKLLKPAVSCLLYVVTSQTQTERLNSPKQQPDRQHSSEVRQHTYSGAACSERKRENLTPVCVCERERESVAENLLQIA